MNSDKKIQKIIDESVEIILNHDSENIKAILLFGSHADDTAIWRSDVDICVVFKKDVNLKEATLFRKKLSAVLPDKVDLQVFNVLPLKIKKSIVDNHKIIFRASGFDEHDFIRRNRVLFFELERKVASLDA